MTVFSRLPLLVLALALPAGAHEPHDPTYWVAYPPGDDPSWLVVMLVEEPKQAALLVRSQDRLEMETLYIIGGTREAPTAAMTSDERLLVGTEGHGLWVSDDVGETYVVHSDIPADAMVQHVVVAPDVLDSGVAVAVGSMPVGDGTFDGIVWRTDDAGDSWRTVASFADTTLLDVSFSPDWDLSGRIVAGSDDGNVFMSVDRGFNWGLAGSAGRPVSQTAAGDEATIWLATADAGLMRSLDDGANFETVAFPGEAVSVVADFGDGLVMAALPEQRVFVSHDGGGNFDLSDAGLDNVETGQPMDGVHNYRLQQGGDGTIYLAAWEGVAWSENEGKSWETMESCPPRVQRGVATTWDEDGDLAFLGGTYGGGLELVTPSKQLARPMGAGLWGGFIKRLAVSHHWGEEGIAHVNLLRILQDTQDMDATWSFWGEENIGDVWDVITTPSAVDPGYLLEAGNVPDGAGWCWSVENGEVDCREPEEFTAVCTAVGLSPTFEDDGLAWVGCGDTGQVMVTDGTPDEWVLTAYVDNTIFDLAPTAGGEQLWVATHGGLYLIEPDAEPQLVAFDGSSVWATVASAQADGSIELISLVAEDGWFRSPDGGQSWETLPRPTPSLGFEIALSPSYSDDGTFAVGSFDGTWWTEDRGQTWTQVHALETLDDDNPFWDFSPSWSISYDDVSWYHQVRTSEEQKAGASLRFRGIGLDLIAPTSGEGGRFFVSIDGEDLGEISLEGAEAHQQSVLELRDLEDSWHELSLTVSQAPVSIDAARVWRQPWYPDDGEDDTGDSGDGDPDGRCGRCATGGPAGGLWLVPALLMGLARRRRDGGPVSR